MCCSFTSCFRMATWWRSGQTVEVWLNFGMYDRMVKSLYDFMTWRENPISVNVNILHIRKLLKTLMFKFTLASCSMISTLKTAHTSIKVCVRA